MKKIDIRCAAVSDAEAILKIYAPYVLRTAITFEYEVPEVEEFRDRISKTLKFFPYLVAIEEGIVIGYAYASSFHARKAYQWSAETSIYVDENRRGEGVGRMLYDSIETALKMMGITNLNACIAAPIIADETLTDASIRFHEKMGYRMIGEFSKCGYKFRRWYNMCWMEKYIGEHSELPEPVKPFHEIRGSFEMEQRRK